MTQRIKYYQIAPEALKALSATRTYLATSAIEPRLRALVDLRVSQINGCAYCVDMHSQEARQAGEVQQRLDCLPVWRETSFYNDRERAALAWTEAVTLITHGVHDEVFEPLKAHFSEKEIVDLTYVAVVINAVDQEKVFDRHGVVNVRVCLGESGSRTGRVVVDK